MDRRRPADLHHHGVVGAARPAGVGAARPRVAAAGGAADGLHDPAQDRQHVLPVVESGREIGIGPTDLNVGDTWRTLTYPGFFRLARRYWRLGLVEVYRDLFKHAYAAQARRYLPELRADDLLPSPAGIRAQALVRDGSLADDFLFAGSARVLHVRNAPSPAATSSLAIAEHVVARALTVFAV